MLKLGENVGSDGPYGGRDYQPLGGGGLKQPMVTAGLITANVKVSSAGMEHRAQYANKENFIITLPGVAASLGFGADPRGNVNIRPFDLLFTYKHVPASELMRHSSGQTLAQFRPPTFSSFTGMDTGIKKSDYERTSDVKMNFAQQEVLRQMVEDKLVKIGFSADWYTFQEPTQKDSGVAAIVAGSFGTMHTGTSVIMPGQLVQWRAPPVVEEYIQEYSRLRRTNPNSASQMQDGRFPALLEPFDARTSTHAIVNRAAKLLRTAFKGEKLAELFREKIGRDPRKAVEKLDAQSNALADFVLSSPNPDANARVAAALSTLKTLALDPTKLSAAEKIERTALYAAVDAMGELFHIASEKIVGRAINLAWSGQQLKLIV
jgi:hypothetical protein